MIHAPLPPTWHLIGDLADHIVDRATVVRAMAYVLAASTADLDDRRECDILLSVPETAGADPLYSRVEVDDCLDDALEMARTMRQQAEVFHASV